MVSLGINWFTANASVVTSFPRCDCRAGALEYLANFPSHDNWVVTGDSDKMIRMVSVMYTKMHTTPMLQVRWLYIYFYF